MKQLDRNPLRRNPVVPAPGHMKCRIELEYPIGEGVAPAEIIEEPAVNLSVTQGLLNLADTLRYGRHHDREASYRRETKSSMSRWLRLLIMLQCNPWQLSVPPNSPSSA
jgi:hypothetical protein